MIGMSQLKKRFYLGLALGSVLGIAGVGVSLAFSFTTIDNIKKGTDEAFNKEFTKKVTVLNQSVIQGQTITSDMITTQNVHINLVPFENAMLMGGEIARYNIPAMIPVSTEMISTDLIAHDVRLQEINTVLLPSKLMVGQSVDVKITFPNGTEYTVLVGKKVIDIQGTTMWLELSDFETSLLNSAAVDSYLNDGTKLYATLYVDELSQLSGNTEESLSAEQKVKNKLYDLIQSELPSLSSLDGEEFEEPSSEEGQEQAAEHAQTVNEIYNFIVTYNNLTSIVTKTQSTYAPNTQVEQAMRENPNITQEALSELDEVNRIRLETLNTEFFDMHEEEMSSVSTGANESIQDQEALRSTLMTSN